MNDIRKILIKKYHPFPFSLSSDHLFIFFAKEGCPLDCVWQLRYVHTSTRWANKFYECITRRAVELGQPFSTFTSQLTSGRKGKRGWEETFILKPTSAVLLTKVVDVVGRFPVVEEQPTYILYIRGEKEREHQVKFCLTNSLKIAKKVEAWKHQRRGLADNQASPGTWQKVEANFIQRRPTEITSWEEVVISCGMPNRHECMYVLAQNRVTICCHSLGQANMR